MDGLKKEIVNDIVGILMGLVPGGHLALHTAQSAAVLLLSRQEKDTITRVAERIFSRLYESVGLDTRNPGAAKSAAYDVLATIKKAELTPEILVRSCLDPKLLFEYVLKYPAVGIESASSVRKGLYIKGIRTFCDELMASALEIKPLQSFVYRELLLNQNKILRLLEKDE